MYPDGIQNASQKNLYPLQHSITIQNAWKNTSLEHQTKIFKTAVMYLKCIQIL